MPSNAFTFPTDCAWLSPAHHPSELEIGKYAAAIAENEGLPRNHAEEFWREAELQLWVWRSETRPPPDRPTQRRSRVAASVTA